MPYHLMQAEKRGAHDSVIWTLAWHPAGHMLATGSGDTCTKFWGRARPGDPWRDREQREQEENAATEGSSHPGLMVQEQEWTVWSACKSFAHVKHDKAADGTTAHRNCALC